MKRIIPPDFFSLEILRFPQKYNSFQRFFSGFHVFPTVSTHCKGNVAARASGSMIKQALRRLCGLQLVPPLQAKLAAGTVTLAITHAYQSSSGSATCSRTCSKATFCCTAGKGHSLLILVLNKSCLLKLDFQTWSPRNSNHSRAT